MNVKLMEPSLPVAQVVGVEDMLVMVICADRETADKASMKIANSKYLYLFIETRIRMGTGNTALSRIWLQVPLEHIAQIAIKIGVLRE